MPTGRGARRNDASRRRSEQRRRPTPHERVTAAASGGTELDLTGTGFQDSAALVVLGEAPQVPAAVGAVAGVAFAAALGLLCRDRPEGGASAFAALSAGLCAVLLLYLGSGYWIGPFSLAVSVAALVARLARHPPRYPGP